MQPNIGHAHIRLRRLRKNAAVRGLFHETTLRKQQLVYPIFVSAPGTQKHAIASLPGVFRIPFEEVLEEIHSAQRVGIQSFMLFPVTPQEKKDTEGTEAYNPDGLMQNTLRHIRKHLPEVVLFADIALDPFTTSGHDGIVDEHNSVLNDVTVAALCKQALSYAECGVDFVSPSDMMDGRIGAIRHALDERGFSSTGILAYSAKYASSFYGPFREAVASGARLLDKKSYQLNIANSREALREGLLDAAEGADILMVKPGLLYLDIVSQLRAASTLPIAIYQVSGEYAMLKFAALNGALDERTAVYETLLSMRRAGADIIVSYYAKWACEHLGDILH